MDNNIITEMDDQRIDELLAYTAGYSEQNAENIEKLFMKKTGKKHSHGRRILLAAAIAAVTIAFTGVAVAASMGFDLGRIYNSFFNNPSAAEINEIGQSIKTDGMEITLLSAFTDGDKAYALLKLKDIESSRLSDSVKVLCKDRGYDVYSGVAAYDAAENSVTLALTIRMHESVRMGDRIELNIDTIMSGINYMDNEPLEFDIAAFLKSGEVISLDEWNNHASGGVKMPGSMGYTEDEDQGIEQLLRVDEMEVSLPNIDWAVITNVGIIDGRLHLQYKQTDAYNGDYNVGYLTLLDNTNTTVSSCFDIRMNGYVEMAFDVGNLDLGALRLAVSGNRIENVVYGPWNMNFVVNKEIPKKSMAVIPVDS